MKLIYCLLLSLCPYTSHAQPALFSAEAYNNVENKTHDIVPIQGPGITRNMCRSANMERPCNLALSEQPGSQQHFF
jgi:hypothetical protein